MVLLDADLEPVYATAVGGASEDMLRGIAIDDDGGLLASGYHGRPSLARGSLIVKMSPDDTGAVEFAAVFGNSAAVSAGEQVMSTLPLGGARYVFAGHTEEWGDGTDGMIGILDAGPPMSVSVWTLGGPGYQTLMELLDVGGGEYVAAGHDEGGPTVSPWLTRFATEPVPEVQWQYVHVLPRYQWVRGSNAALRSDGGIGMAFQDGEDANDTVFEMGVLYTNGSGRKERSCPEETPDPYSLTAVDEATVEVVETGTPIALTSATLSPSDPPFDPFNLTQNLDLCQ